MKLIWYLTSFLTISLILLNNPKSTDLGGFGSSQRIFSLTRGSQKKLQLVTATSIFLFFLLTIFFALYSYK